jgi:ATP-dependent DNA helicase RecG
VAKGHQVYVVCPRISGVDDDGTRQPVDADDGSPMAAVDEVAPMLAEGALAGLRVAALHGRLAADVKDRVMLAFAAGEVDVLVATTVIEVGVDVANATMMLIFDAERFGVSQLHQLRGRIGRGGLPGLCLLVTKAPAGSPGRLRVEAVAATTDGFELSQVDLQQRREGDVLGSSQSGRRSSLRLLHVLEHEEVIVAAREVAAAIVGGDPDLREHPRLAEEVRRLDETEQADFLGKA